MKNLSALRFTLILLLAWGFTLTPFDRAIAQETREQCGTVLLQEKRAQLYPEIYGKEQFEEWLVQERLNKSRQLGTQRVQEDEVLTIPVVVHVIHDPSHPDGVASNISLERIQEQIKTLTEDFRRLNADTTQTPSVFKPVAADVRIEFQLAKQDPEGLPTNGVVRIPSEESYGYAIFKLTELSYWPPEDYMNIYVTTLSDGLLGYATFPASDLPGLDGPSNELGEGIAVSWPYFSTNGEGTSGRTLTHEVGHYLGLRHIWGDGGCGDDDFCEDTPPSDSPNFDCQPEPVISCGSENMISNFMDYTEDKCMNAFTNDQKERIRIVMDASPRRNTLAKSPGLSEPTNYQLDAGIRNVSAPGEESCANETIVPTIDLRNYGSETVTSVKVEMKINGTSEEIKTFNLQLQRLDAQQVSFSPYTPQSTGEYTFSYHIVEINGQTDENSVNDNEEVTTIILPKGTLPQLLTFEQPGIPQGWTIYNQDDYFTWEHQNAPNGNPSNGALSMQYGEYEYFRGSKDRLYSPVFNLGTYLDAKLSFSIAYALYPNYENDRLRVKVLTGCSAGQSTETVVFDRRGEDLATANQTFSLFRPAQESEWKRFEIDLSPFINAENVTIVFEGENGYGNNLYLDDISITGGVRFDNDLAVKKISNPQPVVCEGTQIPQVEVRNTGRTTVDEFSLRYTLNDGNVEEATYSGQPLSPGEIRQVSLPAITAARGSNKLKVEVLSGSGIDENKENDSRELYFNASSDRDIAPLRVTFDNPGESAWTNIASDGQPGWETVTSFPSGTSNTALKAPFYNTPSETKDRKLWYASPILDMSEASAPSLEFDISYSAIPSFSDTLTVMVSGDCGMSFIPVANLFGDILAENNYTDEAWNPDSSIVNWRHINVELSQFTGQNDIQLAIVATNGQGNNLYLDNIEVNVTNETGASLNIPANEFIVYPNPAGPADNLQIGFNFEERQNVGITLTNSLGEVMAVKEVPNILNQVYTLDLDTYPGGLYFIKIKTNTSETTKKVLLVR